MLYRRAPLPVQRGARRGGVPTVGVRARPILIYVVSAIVISTPLSLAVGITNPKGGADSPVAVAACPSTVGIVTNNDGADSHALYQWADWCAACRCVSYAVSGAAHSSAADASWRLAVRPWPQ